MSMSSSQDHPVSEQQQSEQRTVVPTQQARQGVTGHNVRYVLGIGIAARSSLLWYSTRSISPNIPPRRIDIAADIHPEWVRMVRRPGLS
jgi:hypothetical protein